MENNDCGVLLSMQNKELQRTYFKSMCKLLGIKVEYRAPRETSKEYNMYGELDTFFYEPISVMCILDEHADQKSLQKAGWAVELADASIVIHVPYDLPKLQSGALFSIPSGIDNAPPRLFRVLRLSTIPLYPASVACELGPIYRNEMEASETKDFTRSNFNVLGDESEEYGY